MAWTTPKDWQGGAALTAAEMDTYVSDNTAWLKDALTTHGITSDSTPQAIKSGGYGCSLTTSGTVNIADSSDVQVQFDTEEWDDAGFHSTVSNTARITIPTGGNGRYIFNGHVAFEANSTGRREVWFEKNGADEYNRVRLPPVSSVATAIQTTLELALVAGDYVVMRARQNSGVTLTASARLQARRTAV